MQHRREFFQHSAAFLALSGFPFPAFSEELSMIVHRKTPLNAEPRPPRLASFITPQKDFYVRNHGNVPKLSAETYSVKVGTIEFSIPDLQKMPQRKVTAVMQCAGNRRADMGEYKHVSGDAWRVGAIGNAEWTGVSLSEVLRKASMGGKAHVAFACHDDCEEDREKFKYGVSIPMQKAMSEDTILAWAMNGEQLTAEHGFPLRLVVPGYAGVRCPKWIASIDEQEQPSDNHIQQKAYKLFGPDVIKEKADFSTAPVVNEMPLNSVILEPIEGAAVRTGKTVVSGFAICTMSSVSKIEASGDGGKTWTPAQIKREGDSKWSWVHWSAELNLKRGDHQLVVRAFDGQGKGQPESAAPIYNFPGYLMTAWHRVTVHAKDAA
ncbi:sulfite oxidase [Bosea sp. 124]|nr:sulfite oxidase [Bosea sp. 124]